MCTFCIICCQATQTVEILHILQLFLICHNLCWGWLPSDSYHHHMFYISFSNLNYSINIPCSTDSSLASNTTSSVYFTCPPTSKSPNPSRASSVRYLLCNLNRISDKQYHFLTPLKIFTLFVSSWSKHILTH
jgi:hypothetical protein